MADDSRNYRSISNTESLANGAITLLVTAFICGAFTYLISRSVTPSIFIGFACGIALFAAGLRKIETGRQLAEQLLGNRTGKVICEGWGWIFSPLYSGDIIDARAQQYDIGEKTYMSKDNVPVSADAACIVSFENVSKLQSFEGDFGAFVKNVLEGAIRLYILKHEATSPKIFKGASQLSEDEVAEARAKTSNFKYELEENGRAEVAQAITQAIKLYGGICDRVIIENVRLPEDIEDAGGEALRESLESAGDTVDWENTISLATTARKGAYTDEQWAALDEQVRGSLWQVYLDQALAKKDQAQRFSFSGGNPFTEAAAIFGGKKE